jgi:hypothetical protein
MQAHLPPIAAGQAVARADRCSALAPRPLNPPPPRAPPHPTAAGCGSRGACSDTLRRHPARAGGGLLDILLVSLGQGGCVSVAAALSKGVLDRTGRAPAWQREAPLTRAHPTLPHAPTPAWTRLQAQVRCGRGWMDWFRGLGPKMPGSAACLEAPAPLGPHTPGAPSGSSAPTLTLPPPPFPRPCRPAPLKQDASNDSHL